MRRFALLLLAACGSSTGMPAGGGKPVLGLGTFAGTLQDAGQAVRGRISVTADSDGRINFHLDGLLDGATVFECNTAAKFLEGALMFTPITALDHQALLTSGTGNLQDGALQLTVTLSHEGQPADRTITIAGTLAAGGGDGTFSAATSAGTTTGTWSLAPGALLDGGLHEGASRSHALMPELDAKAVQAYKR